MCDWVRTILILGKGSDTRLQDIQYGMLDNGLIRAEFYNFSEKYHVDFDIQCEGDECKIADIYDPNSYKNELKGIVEKNEC